MSKDNFFGKMYYNNAIMGSTVSSNLYPSGECMIVTGISGTTMIVQRTDRWVWPHKVIVSVTQDRQVVELGYGREPHYA